MTTHYHWDHCGGNKNLKQLLADKKYFKQSLPIYGGKETQSKSLACITDEVTHLQKFKIGNFLFQAIKTPGHTISDFSFVFFHHPFNRSADETIANSSGWSLFTGDVLFSAGCGKFFECTPDVMFNSLSLLKNLHGGILNEAVNISERNKNTLIWPGHEYTCQNLHFVYSIDPGNQKVVQHLEWAQAQRAGMLHTVPSTLATELEINPFLRPEDPTFTKLVSTPRDDPNFFVNVLAHLRKLKDNFK